MLAIAPILKNDSNPQSCGNDYKQASDDADKQKGRLRLAGTGQKEHCAEQCEADEPHSYACGNRFPPNFHSIASVNCKLALDSWRGYDESYRPSSEETEIPPRVKQSTRCRNDKATLTWASGTESDPFTRNRERMATRGGRLRAHPVDPVARRRIRPAVGTARLGWPG